MFTVTVRTLHSAGHPVGTHTDTTVSVIAATEAEAIERVSENYGSRSFVLSVAEKG